MKRANHGQRLAKDADHGAAVKTTAIDFGFVVDSISSSSVDTGKERARATDEQKPNQAIPFFVCIDRMNFSNCSMAQNANRPGAAAPRRFRGQTKAYQPRWAGSFATSWPSRSSWSSGSRWR